MPRNDVSMAETIRTFQRSLRTEGSAGYSQTPIAQASNRGNKLRKGATFVHQGNLACMTGPDVHKQKIDYNGFSRSIFEKNPARYDEEGFELNDSESDEEADAVVAEQNPYSSIRLEELLAPLKHPSELLTHPSMSQAYISKALPNMVLDTEEKLRQEKLYLWRAKGLFTQFMGDESWMPPENIEALGALNLFPLPLWPEKSKKRKRDELVSTNASVTDGHPPNGLQATLSEETLEKEAGSQKISDLKRKINSSGNPEPTTVEKAEEILQGLTNGTGTAGTPHPSASNGLNGIAAGGVAEADHTMGQEQKEINGILQKPNNSTDNATEVDESDPSKDRTENPADVADMKGAPENNRSPTSNPEERTPSPQPPPRRITRALAHNNSNNHSAPASTNISPPVTPSYRPAENDAELSIHPIFLMPPSTRPSNTNGLPPEEALDTRRLLANYIQKQEESIRGYQNLLDKLLKAQRLRENVMVWCKVEGHVGEMSDGEDWVDLERWGLLPGELRKGRDEEGDGDEEERQQRQRKPRRRGAA